MIVKVQISLDTTEAEPQVLIYDRTRDFVEQLPLSACPGLEEAMADAGPLRRAYFKAKVADGKIQLIRPVQEQTW